MAHLLTGSPFVRQFGLTLLAGEAGRKCFSKRSIFVPNQHEVAASSIISFTFHDIASVGSSQRFRAVWLVCEYLKSGRPPSVTSVGRLASMTTYIGFTYVKNSALGLLFTCGLSLRLGSSERRENISDLHTTILSMITLVSLVANTVSVEGVLGGSTKQ